MEVSSKKSLLVLRGSFVLRTNLSQTHFVCEDAVDSLLVEIGEPVETLELIVLELSGEHLGLLDRDVSRHRWVLEVEFVRVDCRRRNEEMCISLYSSPWGNEESSTNDPSVHSKLHSPSTSREPRSSSSPQQQ